MKHVCVFCGSTPGNNGLYVDTARQMGEAIARQGLGLVYGGGHVGLMGAVAEGALQAGGHVIGIIPQALVKKELEHHGLSELHIVGSMHERKAMMAEKASMFVALPGGFGTLDELFEIITWAQLGFHSKPIGLLNTAGYFNPLLKFIEHIVDEGFVNSAVRAIINVADDAESLLHILMTTEPPQIEKWLKKADEL
ncbi:MAG: TIGR00730 family Rossman fold protein [Anaerolineae bacterium]